MNRGKETSGDVLTNGEVLNFKKEGKKFLEGRKDGRDEKRGLEIVTAVDFGTNHGN